MQGAGFKWSSVDYASASDTLAVVGERRFAVMQDAGSKIRIATVEVHGQAMGLQVENLLCCAKLSPDGKTVYSMAKAVDNDNTSHTIIGAFDAATGEFTRTYAPHIVDPALKLAECAKDNDRGFGSQADCEDSVREHLLDDQVLDANGASIDLEDGQPQAFAFSADGKTLYMRAITGIKMGFDVTESDIRAEKIQIVAIDTLTGQIRPLPISAYGAFGLCTSGHYLLAEQAVTAASPYAAGVATHGKSTTTVGGDDKDIKLYALPDGHFVRSVPGQTLITNTTPKSVF